MKKILIIAIVLSLCLSVLASCKIGGNSGDSGGNNTGNSSGGSNTDNGGDVGSGDDGSDSTDDLAPEGAIYGKGVSTFVLGAFDISKTEDSDRVTLVLNTIGKACGVYPGYTNDATPTKGNEIVIGDSSRDITASAYDKLDARIRREIRESEDEDAAAKDLVGYAIYATGGSVAVVWSDWHVEDIAFDYFVDNYLGYESLVLKDGYTKTEVFSLSEYLAERGEQLKAEKWDELESALGDYGPAIVKELKTLYSLYTVDMVYWMADLYDPETGAWYSCASARDYDGISSTAYSAAVESAWGGGIVEFGPTIESTWSGIAFADGSGMAEMFGGDWVAAMPDWVKQGVIDWLHSLQNPDDGLFYHPQWPKEKIVAGNWQSRLTRDRNSATSVLKLLGSKPLYSSSLSSEQRLPASLGVSTVSAVSKVVSTSSMLSQFESPEKFREYLDGLEKKLEGLTDEQIAYQFYAYGNEFQSLISELNANPEIKAMLVEFFDSHQNPENGTWSKGLYYDSASCLHKIGDVYNRIGAEVKYVDQAINSVITILNFDVNEHPAKWGVDIYNTWSVFPYIYRNIRNNATGTSEEKEAKIQSYINMVYDSAPEMISNSFKQISRFRYDNGAFGYYPVGHPSGGTSQGIPSSVPNIAEATTDGNGIASKSLVDCIFGALEMSEYRVPYFTEAERVIYVNRLEELGAIIKDDAIVEEDNLEEDIIFDFEDVNLGEVPEGFSVSVGNYEQTKGTYAYVSKDGKSKVFEIYAKDRGDNENGRNPGLSVPIRTVEKNPNAAIIEMDIKFDGDACSKSLTTLIQFSISYEHTPVIYPYFAVDNSGNVWIYSYTKEPLANIGKVDEYIDLRIEYYWVEGIYKIYVDGMFRAASTDNYSPGGLHRKVNGIGLSTPSTNNARYYIDNLRCVNVNKTYVDGSTELLAEKIYTFNNAMPSAVTVNANDGSYGLARDAESGERFLELTNAKSGVNPCVSVTPYVRTLVSNSTLVEMDISVPNAAEYAGSAISRIDVKNADGDSIWQIDVGVNAAGMLYFENAVCLGKRVNTTLSASEINTIRLVSFIGAGAGKCDDMLFIYAGDTDTAVAYTFTKYQSVGSKTDVYEVSFGTPDGEGEFAVRYDNVRVEKTITAYKSPIEYSDRTHVADSDTLDFEDRNVGNDLPDRITGDAVIGAEIDDSNRFLQLLDTTKTGSSEAVIKIYNDGGNYNNTVIEFTAEYLTASMGRLHNFTLVDKDGNEESIFYISRIAYGQVSAIRPFTYNTGANWNFTKEGLYNVNLDANANVITREAYNAGLFTGNYVPLSEVRIRLVIDWHRQTVSVYFNETYNNLCKGEQTTVYTMSLTNVDALKISSYAATESVLNVDDLTTRNYYTTPPTPHTSPDHSFDNTADTPIVDYIENGVNVIENGGAFEFGGYENAGDDGYLKVDGTSGAPEVIIPSFVADGVEANGAVVELDLDLSELSSANSAGIALLDVKSKSFVGIALRKNASGNIELVETNAAFTKDIATFYTASNTRLHLKLEYFADNGYLVVTVTTPDGKSDFSILVITAGDGFSGIKLSVFESASSSFKLYSAHVESVYADLSLPMGDDEKYTFDSDTLPDGVTADGSYGVSGGKLTLDSGATVTLPSNIRSYLATGAVIDMKISADDFAIDLYEITFRAINGKDVYRVKVSVNYNGEILIYDPVCMTTPVNTGVTLSQSALTSMRFEYYWNAGDGECELVLKVYVGDMTAPVANLTTPLNKVNYEQAVLKTVCISASSEIALDDIQIDNKKLAYTAIPLPEVTPGEDKATVDFEDSNIGSELPERFEGDASVSAEVDGSNRYLFIDNADGAGSLIIKPYGEREGATALEFEFDIEYLYKAELNKIMHTFILVDSEGNETTLFNLLNMHTGAGWAVRATNRNGGYISGGPNVISRQQMLAGKLSGNGGDRSKTVVKIFLDLESGIVTATFRGTRADDTFTVTATSDAVALKIAYGECPTALIVDNVRAEYVHPIPEYNLGFVVDGEEYHSITTLHNAVITLPTAPEKDGYTFDGWFFDDGVFEKPLTATTLTASPLTADTLVYAKFTEIPKYTVSFVVDGEVYSEETIRYNALITLPTAPEKDGYTFDGWFFDNGVFEMPLSEDSFVASPLSANVSVYAKFTEIPSVPEPEDPPVSDDTDSGEAPDGGDVLDDAWAENDGSFVGDSSKEPSGSVGSTGDAPTADDVVDNAWLY